MRFEEFKYFLNFLSLEFWKKCEKHFLWSKNVLEGGGGDLPSIFSVFLLLGIYKCFTVKAPDCPKMVKKLRKIIFSFFFEKFTPEPFFWYVGVSGQLLKQIEQKKKKKKSENCKHSKLGSITILGRVVGVFRIENVYIL